MKDATREAAHYLVYRIEFSGARRYVGMTYDLKRRLRNHKSVRQSRNSELCRLMRSEPYKVRVLARDLTHAEASAMERDVVRKLKNPLNWTYAYGKDGGEFKTERNYNPYWHDQAPCRTCREHKKATEFWRDSTRRNGLSSQCIQCAKAVRHPPREGKHPCHVCRQRKPLAEFHATSSRKSGVSSKCKKCGNAIKRAVGKGKSQAERSEAYHEAVRLIRAGEDVPYRPPPDYGEHAGTTRKCPGCEKRKPIEKFAFMWRTYKDGTRYRYFNKCHACENERQRGKRRGRNA